MINVRLNAKIAREIYGKKLSVLLKEFTHLWDLRLGHLCPPPPHFQPNPLHPIPPFLIIRWWWLHWGRQKIFIAKISWRVYSQSTDQTKREMKSFDFSCECRPWCEMWKKKTPSTPLYAFYFSYFMNIFSYFLISV